MTKFCSLCEFHKIKKVGFSNGLTDSVAGSKPLHSLPYSIYKIKMWLMCYVFSTIKKKQQNRYTAGSESKSFKKSNQVKKRSGIRVTVFKMIVLKLAF